MEKLKEMGFKITHQSDTGGSIAFNAKKEWQHRVIIKRSFDRLDIQLQDEKAIKKRIELENSYKNERIVEEPMAQFEKEINQSVFVKILKKEKEEIVEVIKESFNEEKGESLTHFMVYDNSNVIDVSERSEEDKGFIEKHDSITEALIGWWKNGIKLKETVIGECARLSYDHVVLQYIGKHTLSFVYENGYYGFKYGGYVSWFEDREEMDGALLKIIKKIESKVRLRAVTGGVENTDLFYNKRLKGVLGKYPIVYEALVGKMGYIGLENYLKGHWEVSKSDGENECYIRVKEYLFVIDKESRALKEEKVLTSRSS